MILLLITIIILYYTRKYFLTYRDLINKVLVFLSIWLVTGTTIRYFFSDGPSRRYTDVEMAQNLIEEDPEFKKAKMKILDDGSVRISLKRKKFLLKDGVMTSVK